MNYPLLEHAYPDIFKKNIDTPTITFLLRDINYCVNKNTAPYSYYMSKAKKLDIISNEIIQLIEENFNRLDWYKKDIDAATPLTYALFAQVDKVADYLIEHIYDISQYRDENRDALGASIRMNNLSYFKKIIYSESIHEDYLIYLTTHSINRTLANKNDLKCYYDEISQLDKFQNTKFLDKFLTIFSSSINPSNLEFFLYNNSLGFAQLNRTIENNSLLQHKFKNPDLKQVYEKWTLFHHLNANLTMGKKNSTMKI